MKKFMFTLFIIFLFPIVSFAYSKYVIPGGESIGIKINTDGLVVVGFYKVNGEYIAKNNFKIGDKIISVNDNKVNTIEELSHEVDKSDLSQMKVSVQIDRNGRKINNILNLKVEDGIYKTGLYVKDSLVGLGTNVLRFFHIASGLRAKSHIFPHPPFLSVNDTGFHVPCISL